MAHEDIEQLKTTIQSNPGREMEVMKLGWLCNKTAQCLDFNASDSFSWPEHNVAFYCFIFFQPEFTLALLR